MWNIILIAAVVGFNLWLLFAEPSYVMFLIAMVILVFVMGRLGMLWILAFIVGFITGLT